MATNLDTLKKIMTKDKLSFFVIKRPDGATIHKYNDESTPEEAAEYLDEILGGLSYPYVEIHLSKLTTLDKKGGGARADLIHRVNLKAEKGSQAPAPSKSADHEKQDEKINAQIMALMQQVADLKGEIIAKTYEAKLQLLERKIYDMEADNKNPMQEAAIMALINAFNGPGQPIAQAPINGHATNESQAPTDEKERLKIAIQKLRAADPNFIETLESIAEIAATNPTKYFNYKPLLKNL